MDRLVGDHKKTLLGTTKVKIKNMPNLITGCVHGTRCEGGEMKTKCAMVLPVPFRLRRNPCKNSKNPVKRSEPLSHMSLLIAL